MSQLLAARPHRLRRLALFGALVLVLRFAGAELHELTATHESGDTCEYCLVLERGGTALPAAEILLAAWPAPVLDPAPTPATPRAIVPPAPLPRGPPPLGA